MRLYLIGSLYFILSSLIAAQSTSKISVHMKSQALVDGKKVEIEANCYYSNETGTFISHYYFPDEFIRMTNRQGEMKIYFPETNEVSLMQNEFFSSENELLHFFINNLTEDLGLSNAGFTLADTRYDDEFLVTTWSAPSHVQAILSIKIVYEDQIPIYSEYLGSNGKPVRKIYYSDYYYGSNFMLPLKITEITYPSPNDSIIKRTIYTDLKINKEVNNKYVDFTIPQDASIID